jgi:hypothetical protein
VTSRSIPKGRCSSIDAIGDRRSGVQMKDKSRRGEDDRQVGGARRCGSRCEVCR